ncbi:hypothetical protein BJ165DRAFT_1404801 [Panaeolus papilionaceus]|nr:hypothetical protein BJ165DRAFT_1404801 [Panaeolus papilionaceus]
MSTVTTEYVSDSIESPPLWVAASTIMANQSSRRTPVLTNMALHHCRDTTIHSPTTHINAFHKNSHELAHAFSQVPWMRFSVVAQPDLNLLAQNEAITKFIHQVTDMTIATVAQEIHEEITIAVRKVIKNIAGSVNETMQATHAGIMKEIVSVTAQRTATHSGNLAFPPFCELLKDLTVEQNHNCDCHPDTTKSDHAPTPQRSAFTELPPVKPPAIKPSEHPLVSPPVPEPTPSVVSPPNLKAASWIWSPEIKTNPYPAVGYTRASRRTIATDSPFNALVLEVAADDIYTVYVNGKLVGCGTSWLDPDRYTIHFEPTKHIVVAIAASQGPEESGVALIVSGKLWNTTDANPVPVEFGSDSKWRCFAAEGVSPKFIDPTFDDAAWTISLVVPGPGNGWSQRMKPTLPGKGAGKRIVGIPKIPDAPEAPIADASTPPSTVSPPNLKAGSWIWSPEVKTNPYPAVGYTRAFRRTILTQSPVNALMMEIAADDIYTVYVNGKLVGCGTSWLDPDRYIIRFEPATCIVVSIAASQGPEESGVALIVAGRLWNTADANPVPAEFGTDSKWLCFAAEGVSQKFIDPAIDDASWTVSLVIPGPGGGWSQRMKPTMTGKGSGKRIVGIPKIPDAPEAPTADAWKF